MVTNSSHRILLFCGLGLVVASAAVFAYLGYRHIQPTHGAMRPVTLADAVIRRTPLGALGYPGDKAVDRAADLVGGALGWSHDRRRSEVAALRRFYSAIFALAKPNPS